ncbi:hypothetical protein GRX03_09050 [Halovenus sp. WSH3]|uniref:GLUG domain-containing protein n=1 Tax=Halovenus carboxidivorans TaxID=2692199 RepID=A0A6B0TEY7_9EURY|nr:GLUG motif-containing protein [Halovenus carboxidivorans]MXR51749.1 hypothetical protein [Halovenus carboxidivorans]
MAEQTAPRSSAVSTGRRQFLRAATATGLASVAGVGAAQDGPTEITDWHDLDAVRDAPDREYVLGADLGPETAGYDEHVRNRSGGWNPIGEEGEEFAGTLDGTGYEIRGLTVDRPDTEYVGLFGGLSGTLRNVTLVDVAVTGGDHVGGLVGDNDGQVRAPTVDGEVTGAEMVGGVAGENPGLVTEATSTAAVTGEKYVGGVVGYVGGDVRQSTASGAVTGGEDVGGLVGYNSISGLADRGGDIVGSTASNDVSGNRHVGGLVGRNSGLGVVRGSTATGTVSGDRGLGGLVGVNDGEIQNSFYDIETVQINGESALTVGGLFPDQYEQWQATDGELSPEEYDSLTVDGNVIELADAQGVRDALAFVHDSAFGWRLTADIDLTGEDAGLYFPFVAGLFDGNGHTITLDVDLPAVSRVGAIGASLDEIVDLSVEGSVTGADRVGGLVGLNQSREVADVTTDVDVTGVAAVGGLAGENADREDFTRDEDERGRILDSTASGTVEGDEQVGGLVGENSGSVVTSTAEVAVTGGQSVGGLAGTNSGGIEGSTATGSVTGDGGIAGLVGGSPGDISNSHYNIEELSLNGETALTAGGLFAEQYEDWEANDRELDLEAYDSLTVSDDRVEIADERGVRDALGFIDDRQFDWRLTDDIDLTGEAAGLYLPYLVGEFDGDGHTIRLDVDLPAASQVGAIGYAEETVEGLTVEGSVTGANEVGGLVGYMPEGSILDSTVDCDVTGEELVGGVVGRIGSSHVERSTASGDVTGETYVGGVVGRNGSGKIRALTVDGAVTASEEVGGIVGLNGGRILRSTLSGRVSGERTVGGVAGIHYRGAIENSRVLGSVSGGTRVGGLAGTFGTGRIVTSLVSGPIDGEEAVGALVGYNDRGFNHFSGTVTDSYWDAETTGQQSALGDGVEITGTVRGLSTDQMQGEDAAEHMSALDFEGIWATTTDPAGYPTPNQRESRDQSDPADSTDESGPGFGLTGVVGGLGGVVYLLSRRGNDTGSNGGRPGQ